MNPASWARGTLPGVLPRLGAAIHALLMPVLIAGCDSSPAAPGVRDTTGDAAHPMDVARAAQDPARTDAAAALEATGGAGGQTVAQTHRRAPAAVAWNPAMMWARG